MAAALAIHGDVLEVMLSHVPLIDLVPACLVSRSWNDAVSSSLDHLNPLKPWLLIHTQSLISTSSSTHAYDPRSRTWLRIHHPQSPIPHAVSQLRSSNSDFLYAISPTKLSYSTDPLHLTWRQVDPPSTWRVDPLVAPVGSHIVVAGGGSEYEDDPLAVEVYDTVTGLWATCQSMPVTLKDSAAPTWLSVAANDQKMFVTEKASGDTYCFSPETKVWEGPYDLRPDPRVFFSTIGSHGSDLILAGLIGNAQDVRGLRLWRVRCDAAVGSCELIGEVPSEFVHQLKGQDSSLSSISLSLADDLVCVYNPAEPEVLIYGELPLPAGEAHGGRVESWESVRDVMWKDDRKIMDRMVFTVGKVELGDLQRAARTANCRFEAE
ncbi:hypothetical protein Dimus_031499 [Dionaea muscipula]